MYIRNLEGRLVTLELQWPIGRDGKGEEMSLTSEVDLLEEDEKREV